MPSPLRLVFLGSDPIALPLLDWISGPGREHADIVAVFTQPDRPTGRGQRIEANAIKRWAHENGLPVRQPEKLTKDEREALARLEPDVSLVMAYGHILGERFIGTPRLGTLNLHASLLPKFRGASPIQTAIASGEKMTGVSLMRIVRELDAGPVADTEAVEIGALDTASEVESKISVACLALIARTLPLLRQNGLSFRDQDSAQATYCRRLAKEDGVLDFRAGAPELASRINGLYPWPGCAVEIAGQPVRIGLAEALPGRDSGASEPGTVLGVDESGLAVATAAGVLRLRRLQRPGGKMLPAVDFLRGFPVPSGTRLPSKPMPPLARQR